MNIRIFLTAWVLFSAHAATNVVREHYPAFALVKRGTFQVDEYQGLHSDIFVHTDGHSYIGNNVATSVIASVPLYLFNPLLDALEVHEKCKLSAQTGPPQASYRVDKPNRQKFFREVSERGLSMRFGAAALITSVFLVAPLSALIVVAMFQMLIDRGTPPTRATWLALVFGFGTPLFFRSAILTNNIFEMYFTFASFWLLWQRGGKTAPLSVVRQAAAGFCAGAAVACDYCGIVPLACLWGYLVVTQWSTTSFVRAIGAAIPFVIGSTMPIGFLMYSQWSMFGDPFRPGQYWMPAVNYTEQGWRGFALPSAETFLLNLLHPSYGMYLFGPILVLGLLPTWRYSSDRLIFPRRERQFSAIFIITFLIFCAANQYSKMQWNTGFRYLLPLVPFIYLAACDHLARCRRWALVAVTLPAVLHSWVLCMARDCNPNVDNWRYAPGFGAWLAQIGNETVPASYLRILHEGPQLPWLRVLQLTSPEDHPVLSQAWLPVAIMVACGFLIAGIWMIRRKSEPPERINMPSAGGKKPLPTVAVVVPVLNEAHVLENSIRTLRDFLHNRFPYPAHIVVVDNGSTDGTGDVALRLTKEYDNVQLVSLTVRGRGRALRRAWCQSDADIVAYMDVDLSTGLEALALLCRGIHEEGYEIATGSRLMRGSKVTRCIKREVLSRGYNLMIKCILFTRFSDAQCGFKAVSRRVVNEIIPLVRDQHWFFDTELLVLGEKLGYRIKDVPVRWLEDPDTRVKIVSTVWEDIKGIIRLRWSFWFGGIKPALVREQRLAQARADVGTVPATQVAV